MQVSYHVVFRKGEVDPEPLKVFTIYYGATPSPRKRENVAGFLYPTYVVRKVSRKWMEDHKQFKVVKAALLLS
jgi:hypothetical protein